MIITRPATKDDVTAWRDLRLDGINRFPKAFRMTLADHKSIKLQDDAQQLDLGSRFLCFDGTCPVGMIGLYQHNTAATRHRAEVFGFYITPAAQGSQAAKTLMSAVVDHAPTRDVWQLELTVNEGNTRAIAVYTRHGFVQTGRIPNALIGTNGPEHDLVMMRQLPRDIPTA